MSWGKFRVGSTEGRTRYCDTVETWRYGNRQHKGHLFVLLSSGPGTMNSMMLTFECFTDLETCEGASIGELTHERVQKVICYPETL